MGHGEHRARAPKGLRCAIITVSDTRTPETDASGREILRQLAAAGHSAVGPTIVPDEPAAIAGALRERLADPALDAVILDGGTGISRRDGTAEVVLAFLERPIPGFGELFRRISFDRIGPAAMLGRATAGVAAGKVVFCLPGSPEAVTLGMESLIIPEIGHIVGELRK